MVKYAVLLLFLPAICLLGQERGISFKQITVEDGLSQGQASFLLKDSDGYVWIGTQDGLNRFDGYSFRHFHHHPGDPVSLSNNYIWCLLEDSRRNIWVGTFGGELCRFDRKTETFQSFPLKPFTQPTIAGNSIRSLCEFPEGTLWIGADKGLWSLNINTLALEKSEFHPGDAPDAGTLPRELLNIVSVHPLAPGQLLVGAGQGLFRVNTATSQMREIRYAGQPVPGTSDIIRAGEREIWVGAQTGLYHLEFFSETDSLAVAGHFSHQPGNPKSLPTNQVNSLYFDEKEVLWVASNEGLSRFDTQRPGEGFTNFDHQENDPNSLANSMVFSILEVEPGLMWAGTREGISVFSNQPLPFLNLNFENTGEALCSESIIGMAQDREDNLWIGTRKGLTRIGDFSKKSSLWEIECLDPSNTPSMPYDYVVNVVQDREGSIWCGFRRNGFARLRKSPQGSWFFEKTDAFTELLGSAGMNSLFFDNQGVTWLGTPGLGLVKWNQNAGEQAVFTADTTAGRLRHPYIFYLHEDRQGRFWIGTANGGLCRMDKQAGAFTCYVHDDGDERSISSNMVLSLFEDSKGRLWACTANGLNLMEEEGHFRRFFKNDGLPNEVVYGMLEDEAGDFWASTNRGISKITFRDGIFSTQNFTAADGLPGNEFNQYAFLKTRDGRFLFGSTTGLTIFNPSDIRPYPYPPPVVLTDFQLFNQSVPVGTPAVEGSFFLKNAIDKTEEIVLQHRQNFIAIEFAALGFTQPENNEYAYQLEGLDVDWVFAGSRRFASYPNLPPGEYTFKVKAANHDGIWNETPKVLKIKVLAPWWQTWWAYLAYLTAAGLAVFGVIRLRVRSVRQIEQAKAAERERFRKRTARDFHDEAGNKITKISLLTEVVKRQVTHDTSQLPLLTQIEENLQELRSGMRDFIWVLDPENDNLSDTLLRLKDFGNGLFSYAGIRFTTSDFAEPLLQLPLNGNQRRHLLLIFKEAMNNCVKYSAASEAKLSATRQGEAVVLRFNDNGSGFDTAKAASGNGLRNMRARAEKLGAEISILSKNQAGATIELVLKTTQMGN